MNRNQKQRSQRPHKPTANARETALSVLIAVEEEGAYSHLMLHKALENISDSKDQALATELVYGTIQRKNTLDYFLDRFVHKGVHRLQKWVACLLRMSLYQLLYLDKIPDHALVHEAVNIAKKRGHQGISGMVNGVLRNILRNKESLQLSPALSPLERIALEHSHPEWLVKRWIEQFGIEITEQMCRANNIPPHGSIRVNRLKNNRDDLLRRLRDSGKEAELSVVSPYGILLIGEGNPARLPEFGRGEITIQDESSMLVADILDPQPGMVVLDACAAPGGKTTQIAEKMNDNGRIIANDVHSHKQSLIEQQAKRLGITSIETTVEDARKLNGMFAEGMFDRILIDAPCSGFGVIRRKPDIKWTKREEDVYAIAKIQLEILEALAPLLKPDGILVYSTCTIEQVENEQVVQAFLAKHRDFILDDDIQDVVPARVYETCRQAEGVLRLLPHQLHTDGFFIARFRKKRLV